MTDRTSCECPQEGQCLGMVSQGQKCALSATATKTPRTDAVCESLNRGEPSISLSELARQLERELTEALAEISRMSNLLTDRDNPSHERLTAPDQLCQECHSALACIEARVCLKRPSATPTEERISPVGNKQPLSPERDTAATEYAKRNPLGGPAVVFEAMASRIRAGEEFYSVLDDYGFQAKPDAPSTQRTSDTVDAQDQLTVGRPAPAFHSLGKRIVKPDPLADWLMACYEEREHPTYKDERFKQAAELLRASTSATALTAKEIARRQQVADAQQYESDVRANRERRKP